MTIYGMATSYNLTHLDKGSSSIMHAMMRSRQKKLLIYSDRASEATVMGGATLDGIISQSSMHTPAWRANTRILYCQPYEVGLVDMTSSGSPIVLLENSLGPCSRLSTEQATTPRRSHALLNIFTIRKLLAVCSYSSPSFKITTVCSHSAHPFALQQFHSS